MTMIKTIPQIFKSGVRIGGYQDLVTYLEEKTNVRISM